MINPGQGAAEAAGPQVKINYLVSSNEFFMLISMIIFNAKLIQKKNCYKNLYEKFGSIVGKKKTVDLCDKDKL